MKQETQQNLLPGVMTVLRILIGWHFLYEGISKLAMGNWSSYAYLMDSKWLFSGLFHSIIANPTTLAIMDFLNIWGLILIGLGLFVGMFTRLASISGIFLLLIYYIANPPFIESSAPVQGHYYIINLNLIEAGILLIFAILKKDHLWSLDRLFKIIFRQRKEKLFPQKENQEFSESGINQRRELIKNLASIPVLGVAFFGMAKKNGWLSFEEDNLNKVDAVSRATIMSASRIDMSKLEGQVPKGKIKHVELSRIIPGGNLVAGFAHARDLIYVSPLIKNYFTDEKVIETMWLYEACGINTVLFRTDEQTIRILKKYWKRGGKIQWLAQTYPDNEDNSNIQLAIDNGAIGAFVMGGIADRWVYDNRMDYMANSIEYIRKQGLICGTAGHAIQVPMACVENGIETDFFMKTFHHDQYWSAHSEDNRREFMHNIESGSLDRNQYHDNLWCASAEDVETFFKSNKTPWIAYKVLAAGSIAPEDGFKFAFEKGADFICVGMFDWQIIPNANIVYNTLNSGLNRDRGWYA
ncbi:DoxX family protein [Bacteroidota bacterium]